MDEAIKAAITIREAKSSDASLLAQAERGIADVAGRLVSHPSELCEEDFARTIAVLAAHPRGKYCVAEIEGEVVGHGFLEPLHRLAIAHVVNSPAAQSPGFSHGV
jgi:hypothetical protein